MARAGTADEETPRGDPGRALERTALAWNRTSLGLAANAALLLRLGLEVGEPLLAAVASALIAAVAAMSWTYARMTTGQTHFDRGVSRSVARPRLLRAVSSATILTAIAGTTLGVLFAIPT